jgi:hypothetical protein
MPINASLFVLEISAPNLLLLESSFFPSYSPFSFNCQSSSLNAKRRRHESAISILVTAS